mmetsp:Transcript_19623/g.49019  ORF Transcript_19623/g.49019 Transcript_19623/m.49019 type:complete len:169 (+) Transcript_19623:326-832(+)
MLQRFCFSHHFSFGLRNSFDCVVCFTHYSCIITSQLFILSSELLRMPFFLQLFILCSKGRSTSSISFIKFGLHASPQFLFSLKLGSPCLLPTFRYVLLLFNGSNSLACFLFSICKLIFHIHDGVLCFTCLLLCKVGSYVKVLDHQSRLCMQHDLYTWPKHVAIGIAIS